MSRGKVGIPRFMGAKHGIENGEKFAHARRNGDFLKLTGGDQSLMKVTNHGVMSDSGQCGHIESRSNIGATTLNVTPAPVTASVLIEGCHAHECGDLVATESTQFR